MRAGNPTAVGIRQVHILDSDMAVEVRPFVGRGQMYGTRLLRLHHLVVGCAWQRAISAMPGPSFPAVVFPSRSM